MLASVAFAVAAWLPTVNETLPNGVRLVVHAWPEATDVAVRVHLAEGAASDPELRPGLAHLLEHVSYEASEHAPAGAYDRLLAEAGGTNNGWTTHDAMVFACTVPPEALERALFLESDRLGWLRPSPQMLANQLEVIANERRGGLREGLASAALARALWPAGHPYARRVIGEERALSGTTLAELSAAARDILNPHAATVVIVGPQRSETLLQVGRRWFGEVPRPDEPTPVPTPDLPGPAQGRRHWETGDVYPVRLSYGWRLPDGSDEPARWAVEVLLDTLAEEEIGANVWFGRHGNAVTLSVATRSPLAFERRLFRTLARLAAEGPAESRVEGLRAIAWTRRARAAETADGRADLLLDGVMSGRTPELPESASTAREIQAFVATNLRVDDAVVVAVVPDTRPRAPLRRMTRW